MFYYFNNSFAESEWNDMYKQSCRKDIYKIMLNSTTIPLLSIVKFYVVLKLYSNCIKIHKLSFVFVVSIKLCIKASLFIYTPYFSLRLVR